MWKDCKICPSYEVSTEGEVRNKKTKKVLKTKEDKNGYLIVGLSLGKRGSRKYIGIHRLVAEAFVPNPYNKPDVLHFDYNNHNNNCANLVWITAQERIQYSKKHGKKKLDHGSTSANAKLSDMEVLYCRLTHDENDPSRTCAALAKKFGVAKSTMNFILKNITYKTPA